ncbi:mitochondrial ATP synthase g subunit-domain-containing protein [Sparassis latifolia]|uniref:ATP synthase subunit g, mitochondrial n=1 Tax=Sparassis crispa TaxID=139825 RepID=A0A401H6G6_9APHY|nr:ATP synthase subunit g, mitochondrial [Sparassis crispa]GBE90012.1 ATP synthase subunit g, mitochondrial [Sparassis crispa]
MVRPPSVAFRLSQARPRVPTHPRLHRSHQARYTSSGPSGADAQKKAQEALSSVQKQLGQAFEAGKKYLGPLGEKFGNLLGGYREPLFYNLAVAREVLKQVYVAERLQPPTSLSTLTSAYATLWSRAINPSYWRQLARSGDWAKVGVYALEAYSIFKIGEIVGRRSLVGYNVQ